jgi:hypothetical protein
MISRIGMSAFLNMPETNLVETRLLDKSEATQSVFMILNGGF